jgi:hypothetical protein
VLGCFIQACSSLFRAVWNKNGGATVLFPPVGACHYSRVTLLPISVVAYSSSFFYFICHPAIYLFVCQSDSIKRQ